MKKVGPFLYIKRIIEASLVWCFYFLLKCLPVDIASCAMGKLLRAIGPLISVSRVAKINLDIVFPHKTAVEKKEILLGSWENLGRVVGEFPHLYTIAGQASRVTVIGEEYVEAMKHSGKSAIVFSAHLGNWEMFGAAARHRGLPFSLIYRQADNPRTDKIYRYARKNIARALYPKNREGAKQIVRAIKNGEALGMLVDQKMNDGVEVPFFGRPAMTASAIAEFALRQHVPIYPARITRQNGVHFTIEIFPAMQLPDTGSHTQNVVALLTEINRLLEQWIAENPKQWFWLHKRWPKELYKK